MWTTFPGKSDQIEPKLTSYPLVFRNPLELEAEYYVECLTSIPRPCADLEGDFTLRLPFHNKGKVERSLLYVRQHF